MNYWTFGVVLLWLLLGRDELYREYYGEKQVLDVSSKQLTRHLPKTIHHNFCSELSMHKDVTSRVPQKHTYIHKVDGDYWLG